MKLPICDDYAMMYSEKKTLLIILFGKRKADYRFLQIKEDYQDYLKMYLLLLERRTGMPFYEKEPISLYLDNLELLEKISSPKQEILFYQHALLGKILIINGEIQHIEKYQTLYHELLVHLPAAFIPHIENVLILGGGSLFAAFEILKYPSVKSVTLCDYDRSVLSLMGKYYEHAKFVLKNPRFNYIERDANEYIKSNKLLFDLIINDCFNIAERSNINNSSYFTILSNSCSPNGVCVDIIYRHIFDRQTTIDTLNYLACEKHTAFSLVTVPEYPGILHLETIWGNSSYISQFAKRTVNQFQIEAIINGENNIFKYYNPDNLSFYLYLPPYIKEMFNL